MSARREQPLRVALLCNEFLEKPRSEVSLATRQLAHGLAGVGHATTVVTCARGGATRWKDARVDVHCVRRLPEAPLRARGFISPLTQLPATLIALRRLRPDVAHAFTATDAQAALLWRRVGGGPVVHTCCEGPDRAALADRRLRLRTTTAAFRESDAAVAAHPAVQAGASRWLALELPVVPPGDPEANLAVYRQVMALGGRDARPRLAASETAVAEASTTITGSSGAL